MPAASSSRGPTPSPAGCTASGSRWSTRSSTRLEAEVRRGGHVYYQEFSDGQPKTKDPKKLKPIKKTGTTIRFWPSPQTFQETTEFDYDTVASRLRETAFLNRGLQITFTDRRSDPERIEVFHYKGGLVDFVKHLNSLRDPLHPHIIDISDIGEDAELEVAMQWTTSYTESVLSFANNINTHEGGTHEEGFRKALTKAINDFARAKGMLKEKDENLTGEDVREGLTAVLSVRVKEPQFEGQTKTKLGNTEIRSYVEKALNRKLPEWLERYSPGGPPHRRQVRRRGQGPGGGTQGPGADPAQVRPRVGRAPRQAGRLLIPGPRGVRAVHRRGQVRRRTGQVGPRLQHPGDPPHPGQDPQRREGPAGQGPAEHRGAGHHHRDGHRDR